MSHGPETKKESKEVKGLRSELELAQKERDEYLAGWKRAKADLINFKKETEQSVGQISDMVKLSVVSSLLPVMDSLEDSAGSKVEGLKPIHLLLKDIFKKQGVEEIKTSPGDIFNPEFHEAVEGKGEKIGEIVCKGYKHKDRVVRPTKVKVKDSS